MNSVRLGHWLFLLAVVCLAAGAEVRPPVTRVLYANDPILMDEEGRPLHGRALEKRMALLKDAYGTELVVLDYANSRPPTQPVRLKGVVLYNDPSDETWVIGDRNPMVDFGSLRREILKKFPSLSDLDDKYDGYRFIRKIVPDNGPPEMRLGTAFARGDFDDQTIRAIEAQVDATMAKYKIDPAKAGDLRKRAIQVEMRRRRINASLGTSFVKVRDLNHSEGKLPKSDKDWVDLYVDYIRNVKPKVLEAERKAEVDSLSLADLLVEIPRAEGRVLDVFLDHPDRVIVQKKVGIHREVRTHVLEGKVMEDATFLRFYPINSVFPDYEKTAIEGFVKEVFLPALKKKRIDPNRFSMTPDIIIEKRPGLDEAIQAARRGNHRSLYPFIGILDENLDIQSGYLFPQEDLFTTGQFGKHFTGVNSRFLDEFEEFKALGMGEAKVRRLKEIQVKYSVFLGGDVKEGFWDRVLAHYAQILAGDPTPERLDRALAEMRRAGLGVGPIFMQFIQHAQTTHEGLRLSKDRAEAWRDHLNRLEPKIRTVIDSYGRLYNQEIRDSNGCNALKQLGSPNH